MIELRLSAALHASAATIDPMPKLAAFGVALTNADRTHRKRTVAAVATVAAAACAAGVAVAQTNDASRSVDVAPAVRTGDTYDGPPEIKVPDAEAVPTDLVLAAPDSPVGARPTFDVPASGTPDPIPPEGGGSPPAPPSGTFSATAAYGSCGGAAPYEYYTGEAPAGQTVTASSSYGGGSVVADGSGHWAMKVYFDGVTSEPVGTTFPVTISTPGYSAQISFTYTGP